MEIEQLEFLKHVVHFNRYVYLDHDATTNVSSHVRRAMDRALTDGSGNPSSLYSIARKSASMMEKARRQVANAIHADQEEVYFTSCATESNNAVLKSLSTHFHPQKKKIISTPVEHPSILNALEFLTRAL